MTENNKGLHHCNPNIKNMNAINVNESQRKGSKYRISKQHGMIKNLKDYIKFSKRITKEAHLLDEGDCTPLTKGILLKHGFHEQEDFLFEADAGFVIADISLGGEIPEWRVGRCESEHYTHFGPEWGLGYGWEDFHKFTYVWYVEQLIMMLCAYGLCDLAEGFLDECNVVKCQKEQP